MISIVNKQMKCRRCQSQTRIKRKDRRRRRRRQVTIPPPLPPHAPPLTCSSCL